MKCLKWIIDAALAACLLTLGALAVPSALGFHTYAVISRSMAPALPVGSMVYVKKKDFDDIRAGDIITFRFGEGNLPVTHRVVEKNGEEKTFQTRGDANERPDGRAVQYAQVDGVVRFAVPWLGYAAVLLTGGAQKLLAGGALCWLFLMRAILSNIMEIKAKEVRAI